MTTPTPSPDVREIAIRTIHDRECRFMPDHHQMAGWCNDYADLADAVLAAVSPVIRRQVAEEIAEAKRHLYSRIIASAHLLDVPFSNAPEQSPWTLLKRDMNALTAALDSTTPPPSPEGEGAA